MTTCPGCNRCMICGRPTAPDYINRFYGYDHITCNDTGDFTTLKTNDSTARKTNDAPLEDRVVRLELLVNDLLDWQNKHMANYNALKPDINERLKKLEEK